MAGGRAIKPSLIMAWVESSACLPQLPQGGTRGCQGLPGMDTGLGKVFVSVDLERANRLRGTHRTCQAHGITFPFKENKSSTWRNQIKATRKRFMALVPRWQRRATHHLPKFLTKANSAGKGSKNYLKYSFWGFFCFIPQAGAALTPSSLCATCLLPSAAFQNPRAAPKDFGSKCQFSVLRHKGAVQHTKKNTFPL